MPERPLPGHQLPQFNRAPLAQNPLRIDANSSATLVTKRPICQYDADVCFTTAASKHQNFSFNARNEQLVAYYKAMGFTTTLKITTNPHEELHCERAYLEGEIVTKLCGPYVNQAGHYNFIHQLYDICSGSRSLRAGLSHVHNNRRIEVAEDIIRHVEFDRVKRELGIGGVEATNYVCNCTIGNCHHIGDRMLMSTDVIYYPGVSSLYEQAVAAQDDLQQRKPHYAIFHVFNPHIDEGEISIAGTSFGKWRRFSEGGVSTIEYSPHANGKSCYKHPDFLPELFYKNSCLHNNMNVFVTQRFHHGSEDYVLCAFTSTTQHQCNHDSQLNFDFPNKKDKIMEQMVALNNSLSQMETATTISGKDGVVVMPNKNLGTKTATKMVKGKLRSTKLVNTKGWNTAKWYNYIMDEESYCIETDIQVINDAVRKTIRDNKALGPEEIRSIFYATLSNTSKSATPEDILAILNEVIAQSLSIETRIHQLANTHGVKMLNDIKNNQVRDTTNFFDVTRRIAPKIRPGDEIIQERETALNLTNFSLPSLGKPSAQYQRVSLDSINMEQVSQNAFLNA